VQTTAEATTHTERRDAEQEGPSSRMHRSTPGNPPSDGELCRLASAVFEALRDAFDVDTAFPLVGPPRWISPHVALSDSQWAILGMRCAHELHSVGDSPPPIHDEDAAVLIGMLDMVLRRLLHDRGREESRAIVDLRELHKIVAEVGTLMSFTAALDGWDPDR
jgi:hypothetical protein